MTGRDTGNGLTPSSHHVLGTSVDKHLVVDVDVGHPHLSWSQDVRSSCLTESLRDARHGHAIGRVRSLWAGRGGSHS